MTDSTKAVLAITNVLDLWPGLGTMIEDACDDTGSMAVTLHRGWLAAHIEDNPDYLNDLRDSTGLACWCKLGEPCHADNLIDAITDSAGHD